LSQWLAVRLESVAAVSYCAQGGGEDQAFDNFAEAAGRGEGGGDRQEESCDRSVD